jgi:hypothetical protein
MVAMFGVMGLLCCGALGVVVYGLGGNQQLANQGANPPVFNPPNFGQPNLNPPNFNPPNASSPFPQVPPPVVPDSADPFEPVNPPPGVPGTPTPPAPKTLDDFLQAMATIDTTNFTARQMLEELNTLPVEDERRTEVVDALLKLLGRAGVHAGGLLAGPGQTSLENWASKAQATSVAQFAAGDANHFARRPLLQTLAKIGGDAETAKALLPLIKDPSSGLILPDVFAKIGPEAEEPLLGELDTANLLAKRTVFAALGKVGGAKSKEKLQALVNGGQGPDKLFSRQALNEINSRVSNNE